MIFLPLNDGPMEGPEKEIEEFLFMVTALPKWETEYPVMYHKGYWFVKKHNKDWSAEGIGIYQNPEDFIVTKIKQVCTNCYLWKINPLPTLRKALQIGVVFNNWNRIKWPDNPREYEELLIVYLDEETGIVSLKFWNGNKWIIS